jgi:hypothetical protein
MLTKSNKAALAATIDWRSRVIPNDNPDHPVASLPDDFVAAITESQLQANKGWAPEADSLIDNRVVECPDCKAPGMNTCWGYWAYTCGAEVLSDGDQIKPCGG